ncbi:MAG: hypothetical protein AAFP77_22380 [Bacteroidota bacterium]
MISLICVDARKTTKIANYYLEEWDYTRFVNELKRSESQEKPVHKKLLAYLKELQEYYFKNDQIQYAHDFKGVISFLNKCFKKDMRLQDFGRSCCY